MTYHVMHAVMDSDHPALRQHPDMIGTLLGLARHAHQDGTSAFPGVPKLAHYVKRDRSTVLRHLKIAEDAKLISGKRRPGKATEYTINLAELGAHPMPDLKTAGGRTHATPQAQGVAPTPPPTGPGGRTHATRKKAFKDPKDKDPGFLPSAHAREPDPDIGPSACPDVDHEPGYFDQLVSELDHEIPAAGSPNIAPAGRKPRASSLFDGLPTPEESWSEAVASGRVDLSGIEL